MSVSQKRVHALDCAPWKACRIAGFGREKIKTKWQKDIGSRNLKERLVKQFLRAYFNWLIANFLSSPTNHCCPKFSVEETMENNNYISFLFDVNRGGFTDVAERILSFLDYASFVRFKQTCKIVYQFIRSSNIEQVRNCWILMIFIFLRKINGNQFVL